MKRYASLLGLIVLAVFSFSHTASARYISADPIGVIRDYSDVRLQAAMQERIIRANNVPRALNHLYGYANQNPMRYIDPYGLETIVIINNNTPVIGTHSGVVVDNATGTVLYDPGGSYRNLDKGSGDALYGKDANLESYINFQRLDGPNIQIHRFQTTTAQEALINRRIEEIGLNIPGSCAIDTSNVLRGIGPFKDLGIHLTPRGLNKALQRIQ